MSKFGNWLIGVNFSFRSGASRLYWKGRLILRALYASTTKDAARSLAHRLEEEGKVCRALRRENTQLLRALQTQKKDTVFIDSNRVKKLENELLLQQRQSRRLSGTLEQLMSEREENFLGSNFSARIKIKFYKNKYQKLLATYERNVQANMPKNKNLQRIEFISAFGAAPVYLALENVLFANAQKVSLASNFTHIIAHDVLGIGSAAALAAVFDAEFWVDLVEDMRLEERTGDHYRKTMSEDDIALLNSYINTNLLSANNIISIGPWQKEQLLKTCGRKSVLLPNYRDPYSPNSDDGVKANLLMKKHKIKEPYICVPNRLRSFDDIKPFFDALETLNQRCKILQIGPSLTEDLSFQIHSYLKGKKIVFLELGECEYDVFRHILSRALYSLVSNSSDATNARQAYPNRLFDCVSSACPIVTFGFTQVADFVEHNNIGVVLKDTDRPKVWAQQIKSITEARKKFVQNLRKINRSMTWREQANQSLSLIPRNSNVLIMSRKDLTNNIRTKNMALVLREKNCQVTLIGGHRTKYLNEGDMITVPLMRKLTGNDFIYDVEPSVGSIKNDNKVGL